MLKRDLSRLSQRPFDLLVIGGDVAASFITLDATLRGLRVAQIAPKDFGQGLESDKLSLVRSGLAATAVGSVSAARQQVHERQALLRIAPNLVKPLRHILLVSKRDWRTSRPLMAMVLRRQRLLHYEHNFGLDPARMTDYGRLLNRRSRNQLLPHIDQTAEQSAIATWDEAQLLHPSRLLLSILKTAVEGGALAANYVHVNKLAVLRGRAIGVEARDSIHQTVFEIRAKQVVDTADVVDNDLNEVEDPSMDAVYVLAKRHISDHAFQIKGLQPATSAAHDSLSVVPWQKHTLIGPLSVANLADRDIPTLIERINRAFPYVQFNHDDIIRVFVHRQPKSAAMPFSPSFLDESLVDHARQGGVHSLLSVRNGNSFETGRFLAQKAVDLVFMKLQRPSPQSRTRFTRLAGGKITHWETFQLGALETWPIEMPPYQIKRYLHHYGSQYRQLLPYMLESMNNCQPVYEDTNVTKAEVIHAVRKEMATKLVDLVLRRTDMGIAALPSIDALELSAMLMGAEYNWSKQRINLEIDDALESTSAMLK